MPLSARRQALKRWSWRSVKLVAWTLVVVVLLVLIVFATTLALLRSEGGRQWILDRVNQTGWVQIGALEGDLWNDVTIRDFVIKEGGVAVAVDRAAWQWKLPDLWDGRFTVVRFDAGTLRVILGNNSSEKKSTMSPEALKLPLSIDIKHAHFDWIEVGGIKLNAVEFSLYSNGQQHWLNLLNLGAQQGAVNGTLAVAGNAPFPLGGTASFRGEINGVNVSFDFNLEGSLRDLRLIGMVYSDNWLVTSDARFDVFADDLTRALHEATLRMDHIDPAKLVFGLPQGDISLMLELNPISENGGNSEWLKGSLEVENEAAGTLETGRVPVTDLTGHFTVASDQIFFQELTAKGLNGIRTSGKGWVRADRMYLNLALQDLNPQKIDKNYPELAIFGTVEASGAYATPVVEVKLEERMNQVRLTGKATLTDNYQKIQINEARLQSLTGKSTLALTGNYDLSQSQAVLKGELIHINPAEWQTVAADINGTLEASLTTAPEFNAEVQFHLQPSHVLSFPITGEGSFQVTLERIEHIALQLASGSSRLQASGVVPMGKESASLQNNLHVTLNVPDLASLLSGSKGSVSGQGVLYGQLTALRLDANIEAQGLMLAGITAREARLQMDAALSGDIPFTATLDVDELVRDTIRAPTARISAVGTLQKQELHATTSGTLGKEPFTLTLAVVGLQRPDHWQMEVQDLTLDSRINVHLAQPARVQVQSERVALEPTTLMIGGIAVALNKTQWTPQEIISEGQVRNIQVYETLKLARLSAGRYLQGNLAINGDWSFIQKQHSREGYIALQRDTGDLSFHTANGLLTTLRLNKADVRVDLNGDLLRATGQLDSARFGQMKLAGSASLPDALPELKQWPFDLSVEATVPDLRPAVQSLMNDLKMTGDLKLTINHSGTLLNGKNEGALVGNNLSLTDTVNGVEMEQGQMIIRLHDDSVVIEQFSMVGGRGKLEVSGGVGWETGKPKAHFAINADRMRLLRRSDMLLVVSGQGDLSYDETGVSLLGKLSTNYGNITYHDQDVPGLSDDVVVVDEATEDEEPDETESLFRIANIEFDVDLGSHFRLRGYGVNTRLSGVLKFRAHPHQALSAYGTLNATDGTYRSYGQKLEIRRGLIAFVGPIDNPTLDILAVREGSPVDAGVVVKGTASRPQVALYSNPKMSTNETLSWLLFDHGIDSIDKNDSAMLFSVLNSVLAGNDGSTVFENLLGGMVDEVGVSSARTSDGETTQIVTINKRLTRNISIGLEKSLNGLQDAVRLSWRLSRSWSVISRFGVDDSSVDVRYTIRFN